ncbi:MAG: hypothetical protein GYB65_17790 [Chloroflexi bacterium]|nr:hypothetical protein [Chloroflexota bacterium]
MLEIGSLTVRHYTAWLSGGILLGLLLILWNGYRHDPDDITRWLDVGLAAVLGGLAGARAVHVAVEWDYFTDHHDEITLIRLGGLSWHGALLTGIPAALALAWLRRVPIRAWTDALALAWPVGMVFTWQGCRKAGCGYGLEVTTLADFPDWQVAELPDVYGLYAPRLELHMAGMLLGGMLLLVMLLLAWQNWLPGVRLWLALALTALGMYIVGFFRADPAHTWYDRRADQVLDLALLFFSTLIGGTAWLIGRRPTAANTTEEIHEDHAGSSPDQSNAR